MIKSKYVVGVVAALLSTGVMAAKFDDRGFIEVESIKGDSQYANAKRFDRVQGIRGSWTTKELKELRSLQPGMSKGQIRDALNSESVNYSSGWRGQQWQHAYNFQAGLNDAVHNVCIVKIDFDGRVAQKIEFKHLNTNSYGNTPDVCFKPEPVEPTVIIREVVPAGPVKIRG